MQRTYEHCGVTVKVEVTSRPGRRFNWTYETSSGLNGKCAVLCAFGVEAAFDEARDEAIAAIDKT